MIVNTEIQRIEELLNISKEIVERG
ncbi:PadR family transcriptional regulator [Clostridium botulinum CFSAN001627]|nr:PadR family transcriptional regulator [Clostridium botulinum CFSAN001627]